MDQNRENEQSIGSLRKLAHDKLGATLEQAIYEKTLKNQTFNFQSRFILLDDFQFCRIYSQFALQLCHLPHPTLEDCSRSELDSIRYHFPFLQLQADALNQTQFTLTDYLGPICPRCQAKGMSGEDARRTKEIELQLRSADEPATIITFCLRSECGYTWTA